jgi:hypothetical protein
MRAAGSNVWQCRGAGAGAGVGVQTELQNNLMNVCGCGCGDAGVLVLNSFSAGIWCVGWAFTLL